MHSKDTNISNKYSFSPHLHFQLRIEFYQIPKLIFFKWGRGKCYDCVYSPKSSSLRLSRKPSPTSFLLIFLLNCWREHFQNRSCTICGRDLLKTYGALQLSSIFFFFSFAIIAIIYITLLEHCYHIASAYCYHLHISHSGIVVLWYCDNTIVVHDCYHLYHIAGPLIPTVVLFNFVNFKAETKLDILIRAQFWSKLHAFQIGI